MIPNTGKYSFIDQTGARQEVTLDVSIYREAADHGVSMAQYLERKYPSNPEHGTTFSQFMQSAGLFVKADQDTGLSPPNLKQVLEGSLDMASGPLVRNDGSDRHGISGRLLFPQVMLELVASALTDDYSDFLGGYNQMIAVNTSVTSPIVDQPTIDVTAPEGSRSQPIAQLAEPATMVTITLAEKAFRIPHKAIALLVSDQALSATTLDIVGITMQAQAKGERIFMVEEQLGAMINGDADWGETALSSITAASLDSTIVAAGVMSQKAWIHYLHDDYRKISINWLMCDLDTAMAIENRTGKPVVTGDDPNSPRIDSLFSISNLSIAPPKIFLLDTAFIGANTIVGIDSRYAIRRVINVNAAYQAIEEWVMRRAMAFRVDYGEMSKKLYPEAWKKMTLTVG
jgi:hypothetical protein